MFIDPKFDTLSDSSGVFEQTLNKVQLYRNGRKETKWKLMNSLSKKWSIISVITFLQYLRLLPGYYIIKLTIE